MAILTADSAAFNVTRQLAITSAPVGVSKPGVVFSVSAKVVGEAPGIGNGPATIRMTSGPSGAALSGTLTRTVTNGEVTFDDLSVNKSGNYTFAVDAYEYDLGLLTATGIDPAGAFRFFDFTSGDVEQGRVCKASGQVYNLAGTGTPVAKNGGVYFPPGVWLQSTTDTAAMALNASNTEELTFFAWGDFESPGAGNWQSIFSAQTALTGPRYAFWELSFYGSNNIGLSWAKTTQLGGGFNLSSPSPVGKHIFSATMRVSGGVRYGHLFFDGTNLLPAGTNAADSPSSVPRYEGSLVTIAGGNNQRTTQGVTIRQVAIFKRAFSDTEMLEQGRRTGRASALTASTPLGAGLPRDIFYQPPDPRLAQGPTLPRVPIASIQEAPPAPIIEETPLVYLMRGIASDGRYVFWSSEDIPDPLGEKAPEAGLSDIIIEEVYQT